MPTPTAASLSGSSDDTTPPKGKLLVSLVEHLGSEIDLILASQSPRRREILDMMGLEGKFTPTPSPLDESALQIQLKEKNPIDYTRILAEEKAKALAMDIMIKTQQQRPVLVLGSDTIVDLDGAILEKPTDEADAKRMLSRLSGRNHCVHTGVAVYLVPATTGSSNDDATATLMASFTDTAKVCFAQYNESDMDAYIATKEPMDKAGSYGIQGIGGQFVKFVEGDFFTVMGLPMHRTSLVLAEAISNILDEKY